MARRRWFNLSRFASIALLIFCSTLLMSGCRTDVTASDSASVYKISPAQVTDTSFVGDTVITNLPYFLTSTCTLGSDLFALQQAIKNGLKECIGLANFDLHWHNPNPAVSATLGNLVQHVIPNVDIQVTRFASTGVGAVVHDFSFSGIEASPTAVYQHTIVVLPAPDRLDVPDVLVLGVGEATLLTAKVSAGTGPRVTTGTLVWGPSSSVASLTATDSTAPESDGRRVLPTTMSLIVRGLTQGKLVVPVYYKKSSSLYDTKAALDAPAMFQKNVTILVGQSVRIVSVQPDGPSNDPSNALTPLSIGSQRQYRLLDENDAIVPTQFWSSSNSDIAFVATTGVATCLSGGTVTITATKPNSSLAASTSITCQGTFSLTVLTAPLSVTAGAQPAQLDTVQINRTNFPAAITLTAAADAGITVTAEPATTTGSSIVISVGVASNVALGTHSVLLTATSGATVVTKSFAVEVKAPVVPGAPTMAVNPHTLSISAGRASTISGVVTNGLNVTDMTWSTKDGTVASLTANGSRSVTVNGLKPGSSTYVIGTYAFSGGTLRDSTLVTVTNASTAQVDHITIEPDSVIVGNGKQVQYRVRYWNASNVEMNGEVGNTTAFTVDDSGIAQIGSSTGLLTIRGLGKTHVTASYRMPYYDTMLPLPKASLIAKTAVTGN
jgi:hypothetical protein